MAAPSTKAPLCKHQGYVLSQRNLGSWEEPERVLPSLRLWGLRPKTFSVTHPRWAAEAGVGFACGVGRGEEASICPCPCLLCFRGYLDP